MFECKNKFAHPTYKSEETERKGEEKKKQRKKSYNIHLHLYT